MLRSSLSKRVDVCKEVLVGGAIVVTVVLDIGSVVGQGRNGIVCWCSINETYAVVMIQ